MSARFLLLLISGIWASNSSALDSLRELFGNKNAQFTFTMDENSGLHTLLNKEINYQRKHNQQLKQLSKPNRIALFESRLLTDRLHAEGYYDSNVTFSTQKKGITYHIHTGEVYRIKDITFKLPEGISITPSILDIAPGNTLRAESVLTAKKTLYTHIAENFCLYHIKVSYKVVIEQHSHLAYLSFTVEDSPSVLFGEIHFTGLQTIDEHYLRRRLPFKKGDCFKRFKLDDARLSLVQTNLIGSVSAQVGEPKRSEASITFTTVERYHRSISSALGFESDEGFGLSLGWEHRNFWGKAQRLRLDSHMGETTQSIGTDLTIPNFRKNNQSATLYGSVILEQTDAFESKASNLGAEIIRQISPRLRLKAGTEISFSSVIQDKKTEDFSLLSLPLSFEYDKRNNPIDPQKGWALNVRLQPYWDTRDTRIRFVKSTMAASVYLSFNKSRWSPTIALRGAFGTINGENKEVIPANVRFYVGGGGSVRGYPFQTLGPIDENTPTGGLSFTEVSLETRVRKKNSHWGGVVFLDGGFAYQEASPLLDETLLWGAGIGLRYYTSFAPIRLDVAVPLDKRASIDDSFQLYLSIGQAF